MRNRRDPLAAWLVVVLLATGLAAQAMPVEATPVAHGVAGSPAVRSLSTRLARVTNGTARFAVRPATGDVTYIGGSPRHPLQPADDNTDDSSAAAREFVDTYGTMFGVDDASTDLTQLSVVSGETGDAVRFEQRYANVPVIGAQVAVQVDDSGAVVSATGEASPQLDIPIAAAISSDAASATAVAVATKYDGADPADVVVSAPLLSVYDPSLLGADANDSMGPRVVWRMDVRTTLGDVDRLVLVDANDGTVALQFSQREDADVRAVCDRQNAVNPNYTCPSSTLTPVLTDANYASASGTVNIDAKSAYDLAGVTYDFYAALGRDSIDNHGMPIVSTVRYCPNLTECPANNSHKYRNAFWSGTQMVYGAGYATADDVVGHELTHGVTQYTSGLFYYADAGAINESMSDVMGELIDQGSTASGSDPPADLWKIGEQLNGGALRSMSDPTTFNDPDKMTSTLFWGSPSDNYGVHTNSGVNNKAAYLIAAGGTFNGLTITGIGNVKTARIYYDANASLLTPGSDYLDLYSILPQACTNLVGAASASPITQADCDQVTKAVTATEMNKRATSPGALLAAPQCDVSGTQPVVELGDNMEADNGAWATSTSGAATAWARSTASSQSGQWSWHVEDLSGAGTSTLAQQAATAIPTASTTYLRFDHSFSTDADSSRGILYEGGVVEYTTDGATWSDITTLPGTINGYNSVITSGYGNPQQGRQAFGYDSPNYETTRIDISSLAGQSVRFRFVLGMDNAPSSMPGWFVDDVSIYSCATAPSPPQNVQATAGPNSATLSWLAPQSSGGLPIIGYTIVPFVGGAPQPGLATGNVTSAGLTGLIAGTSYTFTVAATTAFGTGAASAPSGPVTPVVGFTSFVPTRLLDTRPDHTTVDGQFNGTGLREPASTTALTVLGRGGIAADAAAVVLNVTVTEAQAPGYVTAYPCGGDVPTASNVNYVLGSTIPNAVVVKVGANGQVCFFTQAAVHLVVDANGYFPAGSSLTPLVPGRLLDSRPGRPTFDGQASGAGVRPAGSITQIPVAGRAGVPADAAAVALNVTVTEAHDVGYITVYPCGSDAPLASNLNYTAGATIANAAVTKVGAGGMVCVYTQAPIHLVVDVNGFVPTGATLVPMIPARLLETRSGHSTADGLSNGIGKRDPGSVTVVNVAGRATIPAGASAVVLNVTVTESAAPGYATVYPCGGDPPTASNLNYGTGTTIANAVITRIGADGTVCIFTQSATHLIADVNAYFGG